MAFKILPPQDYLRECLDYSPETGVLTWRTRPLHHFPDLHYYRIWNVRWAGKQTGKAIKDGHIHVCINNCRYGAHRIIWKWMTGKDPIDEIDHRDTNPGNNRWTNLREATKAQNLANSRTRRDNTSGFKGVTYCSEYNRFRAIIYYQRKPHHLGYFPTASEAHAAYVNAAKQLFGEFARF